MFDVIVHRENTILLIYISVFRQCWRSNESDPQPHHTAKRIKSDHAYAMFAKISSANVTKIMPQWLPYDIDMMLFVLEIVIHFRYYHEYIKSNDPSHYSRGPKLQKCQNYTF